MAINESCGGDFGCETDTPDTSGDVVPTQQQFMSKEAAPNLMSHSYQEVGGRSMAGYDHARRQPFRLAIPSRER